MSHSLKTVDLGREDQSTPNVKWRRKAISSAEFCPPGLVVATVVPYRQEVRGSPCMGVVKIE